METKTETINNVLIDGKPVVPDQIVFFNFSLDHWPHPITKKAHHANETKSVTLRGKVVDAQGDEFSALLFDNNNFEKDGKIFVFHKGNLLSNQSYTDYEDLGKWRYSNNNQFPVHLKK